MYANVGDELTVPGARGDDDRHGQILEVRGADGEPLPGPLARRVG
jgi:hypothetical protein